MIKWGSYSTGYEVSIVGDMRFSPTHAILSNGISIHDSYQELIKQYTQTHFNHPIDYWQIYLNLWRKWAEENEDLMYELRQLAELNDNTLTDMYAKTPLNQARALATILNEKYFLKGDREVQ